MQNGVIILLCLCIAVISISYVTYGVLESQMLFYIPTFTYLDDYAPGTNGRIFMSKLNSTTQPEDTGQSASSKEIIDVNSASKQKCASQTNEFLSAKITDENLIRLYSSCFPNERKVPIGAELFKKLFVSNIFGSTMCGENNITFISGEARPLVALPSFPGSGNTWTRILLDQMTGIYTGSVFNDPMSNNILIGSTVCSYKKVFIIKTHLKGNATRKLRCRTKRLDYSRAIYILRNPYAAVLAEFNRHNAGKTDVVSESVFSTEAWYSKAASKLSKWAKHVVYWLTEFKRPVHVLVYEDLQRNTLWELYKISKFVDVKPDYKTMWCIRHSSDEQAKYRREKPSWMRPENLYRPKQKTYFNRKIRHVSNVVGAQHGIKDFLMNYQL